MKTEKIIICYILIIYRVSLKNGIIDVLNKMFGILEKSAKPNFLEKYLICCFPKFHKN